MARSINIRLLIRATVVVVVLAVAVHFLHAFQLARHTRTLLEEGTTAADARDYPRAALYLGRYLLLRPDDLDAQVRYGLVLERAAVTTPARWRAYYHLDKVLSRQPDRSDLRQVLGHLAVRLGRHGDAVRILEALRGQSGINQAELEQALAWCHIGAGDRVKAGECFRASIRHDPKRIAPHVQLADLFQRREMADDARRVMDDLVRLNRTDAEAWAARAQYRWKIGKLNEASQDFEEARKLAPNDLALVLELARLARVRDRIADARQLLRDASARHPTDSRPILDLAQLEADRGRLDEAVALLRQGLDSAVKDRSPLQAFLGEVLLELGKEREADAVLEELGKTKDSPFTAYLEACREARRGDPVSAARRFEVLRPRAEATPFWAARVAHWQGRCYAACGDHPRRVEAHQRALQLSPASRIDALALARALVAVGRYGNAAEQWKKIMARSEPPREGWLEWARAVLRHRPAGRPDLREAEEAVKGAERGGIDPAAVEIARAELLSARSQFEDARVLLGQAVENHPSRRELPVAQSDLLAAEGQFRDAIRLLDEAPRPPGGPAPVEYLLAKVRHARLAGLSFPGGPGVLAAVAGERNRYPAADQARLLQALTDARQERGDPAGALDTCREWCRLALDDLRAAERRFELGLQTGREKDLREALSAMQRIEGPEGVRWRSAEASLLLAAARQLSDKDRGKLIEQARTVLADAERHRHGWGRLAYQAGVAHDLEGRTAAAVEAYQRASNLGERDDGLAERLTQLLSSQRRYPEVERVVRRWQDDSPLPVWLGDAPIAPRYRPPLRLSVARLGAEAAVELRDYPRAVELAQLVAAANPRDPRDPLWLAGLQETANRPQDARRTLEKMLEQHPGSADGWVALLRLMVKTGQRKDAEDALVNAEQRLARSSPPHLALARCQEVMGSTEKAEQFYFKALKDSPSDPRVLRQAARFYLDADQPEKALPILRVLADSPVASSAAWARRELATMPFQLLALGRFQPDRDIWPVPAAEGLKLLDRNKAEGGDTLADERTRIIVRATGVEKRRETQDQFEATLSKGALTPQERYWLATLLELNGETLKTDPQMTALMTEAADQPRYLAAQVRLLLSRENRRDARMWLKRLESLEPDSPRVRALTRALDN